MDLTKEETKLEKQIYRIEGKLRGIRFLRTCRPYETFTKQTSSQIAEHITQIKEEIKELEKAITKRKKKGMFPVRGIYEELERLIGKKEYLETQKQSLQKKGY